MSKQLRWRINRQESRNEEKNLIFDVGNCLPILRKHALDFFSLLYMKCLRIALNCEYRKQTTDEINKKKVCEKNTQTIQQRRVDLSRQWTKRWRWQNIFTSSTYEMKVECGKAFDTISNSVRYHDWTSYEWRWWWKRKNMFTISFLSFSSSIVIHSSPLLGKIVYLSTP